MRGLAWCLFALCCCLCTPLRGQAQAFDLDEARATFQRGLDAYRVGEYASAEQLWRSIEPSGLAASSRAALARNLGNSLYRQGRELESVACFQSALCASPRDAQVRADLELARRAAGLEPLDRGDLSSSLQRAMDLLRPEEARLCAWLGLLVLLVALLFEALRGGRLGRWLLAGGLFAALLAALPLLWQARVAHSGDWMCVAKEGVEWRAEPRLALNPAGHWQAGLLARQIDALPGWSRLESASGERGWVPAESFVALGE